MEKKIDWQKIFLLLIIFILLIYIVSPKRPLHPRPDKFFKELKLTSTQVKLLQQKRAEDRDMGRGKMKQIKDLHDRLISEVTSDYPEQAKINQLIGQINALERDGLQQMVNNLLELKKILTSEQLETLKNLHLKKMRKGFSRAPF